MNKKNYSLTKIIATLLFIGVALLIFYKCPFEYIIGISCPGCGMTRALLSCLKLDFKAAFYYHPLFPLVIVLMIVYFLYLFKIVKLSKKTINLIIWTSSVIFIIVYFIRMFSGSDIVNIHIEQSVIGKIFNFIV